MKRILSIFAIAALLGQATVLFAQESDEPSIKSVLDAARAKYWQDKSDSDRQEFPYTPVLISFVPGISVPFGYYDVSLASGALGSITRDVSGAAGSGIFTIARDVRGLQSSGIFNIARQVKGFQGAGIFNIAGHVAGGQAAGIFNIADSVSGVQIGLVNIAKRVDGVQLGLINIAGNGVDSIGLYYEPRTDFTYAQWQAGAPAFYTTASLGAPSGDWLRDFGGFVASFGLGSRTRMLGLNLDLDVSAETAIGKLPFDTLDRQGNWEGWSLMRPYPTVRLTAGLPIGRHLQIVGGVKLDIDVDALGDRVPESLKKGSPWGGSLFGEGFTAWPKWFFGAKIQRCTRKARKDAL